MLAVCNAESATSIRGSSYVSALRVDVDLTSGLSHRQEIYHTAAIRTSGSANIGWRAEQNEQSLAVLWND